MVKILKKGEHSKGSSSFVLSSCKFNIKCTIVLNHWKLLNPNHEHVFLPWDKFLNDSLSCILRIKGPNVILHKVSHMLWLAEILKKSITALYLSNLTKLRKQAQNTHLLPIYLQNSLWPSSQQMFIIMVGNVY